MRKIIATEISKRLSEELQKVNKTQLASQLGVTERTVYRILGGQTTIKAEYISEISKLHDIDVVYVITGKK